MDVKRHWNARLHAGVSPALKRLAGHNPFAAFVANVDAMKFIDGADVSRLLTSLSGNGLHKRLESGEHPAEIKSPEDFAAALYACFSTGKALELPCYDARVFDWFAEFFGPADELRMGGQAGIIANQLAALGAKPACYCPMLSPKQAALFDRRVSFPIDSGGLKMVNAAKAANPGDATKVNWIFEFGRGECVDIGGRKASCPRSNRLIVLSKLNRVEPLFRPEMEPLLPSFAMKMDRAMVAGFHHLHFDNGNGAKYYLNRLCGQLDAMKKANRKLRVHIEYVMISDRRLAKTVYEHVGRPADSLGINEVEMRHVLELFGMKKPLAALQEEESANSLYGAAKALAEKFNFMRVHAHTLGYYVLYEHKKAVGTKTGQVTESLMLAAKASEVRAALGRPPTATDLKDKRFDSIGVSEAGIAQFYKLAGDLGLAPSERRRLFEEGVVEFKDHFLFLAPSPITPTPKSTVGLGDTISSAAFCSEP